MVADEIGDQREDAGRDDGGDDRQAVQPVGQVHGVGRAHHHEHRDQREQEAEGD